MARRKLSIKEGDWFAVPLEDGLGYVLGVAARVKQGKILGYFFKPKYASLPGPDDIGHRHYEDAVDISFFGDPALVDRTWPIVKHAENWDRAAWPMPVFHRAPRLGDKHYKVFYDEDTLDSVATTRCTPEEGEGLPKDGFSGCVAVQRWLAKLLEYEPSVPTTVSKSSAVMPEPDASSGEDFMEDDANTIAVHWKLSDDPEEAEEQIEGLLGLDEMLEGKLQSEALSYDGMERGQGWFIMFFSGKDIDAMERKLLPAIMKTNPRAGSYLIKQYSSEQEDVRVELA